jgi:hypothetical protein
MEMAKQIEMKNKFDHLSLGIITGLLLPALVLLMVFLYRFKNHYTLTEFFDFLRNMKVLSKMISLCIIPNLLLFFIYIWTDNDRSARGVLGSTFFWALVVVLAKFVL